MSYDLNKLVKLSGLQELAQRIANLFATKEEINDLEDNFIVKFTKNGNEIYANKTWEEVENAYINNKTLIFIYDQNIALATYVEPDNPIDEPGPADPPCFRCFFICNESSQVKIKKLELEYGDIHVVNYSV